MSPSTCRKTRRGYYTGWLQTSPTLGIVLSLIVIIATRTYFGEAVFNDWAWRIPFLCSFLLVFVTMYMRANFEESPVYAEIKAKGQDQQESLARGLPQSRQSQVRGDRHHRGAWARAWSGTRASSGRCSTCRRFPRWTRSPAPSSWESGWSSGPRHSSSSAGCPTTSAASR